MALGFFNSEETLTPEAIDRRRKLAEMLMQQGMSEEPIKHWTQGAARVMKSASGAFMDKKLSDADKANRDYGNQLLASILGGGAAPGPRALPGAMTADPQGSNWTGGGQPAPQAPAPPAPVPQQPLMPNRPQMPVAGAQTAEDGTPMPPVRPESLGTAPGQIPQAFGSLNMPVSDGSPVPLFMQNGITRNRGGIGMMPVSPDMAFNEPGPRMSMASLSTLPGAVPAAVAANPSVLGHGQAVNVPPGAPAGTPQIVANGGSTDATFSRMLTQESGNRQFRPDGSPVTSSAGAIGIAQVMPGTGPEAARLAGVPWDPVRFRNDANYNRMLGKAYYDAQVARYGDPVTAAAAYNAGPGNVDRAIRRQEQSGQPFTDFLPRETQNYIAKVGGPDMPAQGAQEAQAGQFNVPGQGPAAIPMPQPTGGVGAAMGNDRQQAIARFLLDPRVPQSMKQSVMPVLTNMMGAKVTYQTDGSGNIIALDPQGIRPPQIVHRGDSKPMIIPEGGTLYDPTNNRVLATGGNKDTPDLKNYNEAVKGGFKGSFADYQIALRRATSAQPESTFNTEMAKGQAKAFGEMAGEFASAKSDIANVKMLREQLDRLPGGFMGNAQAMAVRMGIKIGENASAIEAADAILNRLTPAQRQGMPGAASDRDVAMFRAALPSLGQTKEGQKLILDTMQGMAQYKLKQAEIAQQVAMGRLKPEQALEQLSAIPDPFEQFKAIQGAQPQGKPQSGKARVISREEYQSLPSGSQFIAADDPTQTVRVKP